MGTRSVTHIYEMSDLGGNVVCSFFRHWDGYPSGHGKDLIEWLRGKKLTNGIGGDVDKSVTFNRAGTMAVKLMNHIQDESGAEVIPTGSKTGDSYYIYHIGYTNNQFYLGCENYEGKTVVWDVETVDIEKLDEAFDVPELSTTAFKQQLASVNPVQQLIVG